jgi:FG-GAP repeat/RTX calcium-binding nonapeptide repeat (4 copies)
MPGFAAVFELSSLDGTNGFQINGEKAGNGSGHSVASAGDVNGDGFDDVIIGARQADPNGTQSGASYVVFGQRESFAAEINLSNLDGTNGFQLSGEAVEDWSGRSVASAGDVNGDGFDDLIIGAFGADPNGNLSGASYVVFGQAGGFAANIDLSDLDGSSGFQINGEAPQNASGGRVAPAGDVNGDGFGDVIIGALGTDLNGKNSGSSFVVFGRATGFAAEFELADLDGTNGFEINGEAAFDFAGRYVGEAADVNGDGFDDLIIGARGADPHGESSGATYVVFGRTGGFSANIQLSDLDGANGFQISGEAAEDHSGRCIDSAGDVNGDGFDDLIIGAYRADPNGTTSGASYVVFGQAEGFAAEIHLSDLDGTNGFQISGETAEDQSGLAVASAGDINGDGFADLIIGALLADPSGSKSGASYVVFGQEDGFAAEIHLSDLDGASGFQISGEAAGDHSGRSVDSAGDVNGDGFDDLIIGAYLADPHGLSSGTSYVIFGEATGPLTRIGTAKDDPLFGGDFADTLRGLEGADTLSGGGDTDVIFGGRSQDWVSGGTGDDLLFVFFGADTLEFLDNDGTDTVVGYKPGIDKFDLTAVAGLASFNDLSLASQGADVLVNYGSGAFLIKNMRLSSVEASDFLV